MPLYIYIFLKTSTCIFLNIWSPQTDQMASTCGSGDPPRAEGLATLNAKYGLSHDDSR
jgi:hypothetical protein